jgi:hypothetical protein
MPVDQGWATPQTKAAVAKRQAEAKEFCQRYGIVRKRQLPKPAARAMWGEVQSDAYKARGLYIDNVIRTRSGLDPIQKSEPAAPDVRVGRTQTPARHSVS